MSYKYAAVAGIIDVAGNPIVANIQSATGVPRVLASLPLLASLNVPAVCSCASADTDVTDGLIAVDISRVPPVFRVYAVVVGPSAVDAPFDTGV